MWSSDSKKTLRCMDILPCFSAIFTKETFLTGIFFRGQSSSKTLRANFVEKRDNNENFRHAYSESVPFHHK